MKILLNGGHTQLRNILGRYPRYKQYVGMLNTANSCYSFERLKSFDMEIALDNSAYSGFSESRFLSMIEKARVSGCDISWVAVPDVVGDARQTTALFAEWRHRIDLPLAYVGQDGCEDLDIPWHQVKALFVGGTTDWKLSQSAASVVREAQRQHKKVHIGRVNTEKRLRFAYNLGADSVDGTGYFRYANRELEPALHFMDGLHRQGSLF